MFYLLYVRRIHSKKYNFILIPDFENKLIIKQGNLHNKTKMKLYTYYSIGTVAFGTISN